MLFKISASLLKTHHHFTPLAFPPPPPSSQPSFLRIRFAFQSSLPAASRSPCVSASLPYGPSIHKGAAPPPCPPECEGGGHSDGRVALDEETFTRVFELTALRVPSSECFSLESRLRGHLLNWPRIPNIARVPGDEVDEDTVGLLGSGAARLGDAGGSDGGVDLDVVKRRIFGRARSDGEEALGEVLCRDKLANTFNSQGYIMFRNLAKISRPKRRRKKKEGESVREVVVKRGNGKSNFAVVEVVQEEEEEDVHTGGGMEGLLGVGYKRQWRGSTRLLLLDERCVGKPFEELPEAIKVKLRGWLC